MFLKQSKTCIKLCVLLKEEKNRKNFLIFLIKKNRKKIKNIKNQNKN